MCDHEDNSVMPELTGAEIKMRNELRYQTMVDSGQATLKAMMIMNGGGTIALLTFISHITSGSNGVTEPDLFILAVILFVSSTFLSVLSYGAIYGTNCYSYADGTAIDGEKRKRWFQLTIGCGFGALGVFAIACIAAGFALYINSGDIFLPKPEVIEALK